MVDVIVLAGPHGSGKTTYAEKMLVRDSHLTLMRMDDVLMELFKTTLIHPYMDSEYFYAMDTLIKKVKDNILNNAEAHIILDCWNMYSGERKTLIERLKGAGADHVICWLFTPPMDTCVTWRLSKPDLKNMFRQVGS